MLLEDAFSRRQIRKRVVRPFYSKFIFSQHGYIQYVTFLFTTIVYLTRESFIKSGLYHFSNFKEFKINSEAFTSNAGFHNTAHVSL